MPAEQAFTVTPYDYTDDQDHRTTAEAILSYSRNRNYEDADDLGRTVPYYGFDASVGDDASPVEDLIPLLAALTHAVLAVVDALTPKPSPEKD